LFSTTPANDQGSTLREALDAVGATSVRDALDAIK
jgi:hypothetical protein